MARHRNYNNRHIRRIIASEGTRVRQHVITIHVSRHRFDVVKPINDSVGNPRLKLLQQSRTRPRRVTTNRTNRKGRISIVNIRCHNTSKGRSLRSFTFYLYSTFTKTRFSGIDSTSLRCSYHIQQYSANRSHSFTSVTNARLDRRRPNILVSPRHDRQRTSLVIRQSRQDRNQTCNNGRKKRRVLNNNLTRQANRSSGIRITIRLTTTGSIISNRLTGNISHIFRCSLQRTVKLRLVISSNRHNSLFDNFHRGIVPVSALTSSNRGRQS